MLCGGISAQSETTEFATAYVAAHTAEINAAVSASHSNYSIVKEAVQVTNGVNHFLHVEGDGQPYTITLLERPHPNHGGVVIEAGAGHLNFGHGYGHPVNQEHANHPWL